jgi:hypothetical protein
VTMFTITVRNKEGLWVFTCPTVASPWVEGETLKDEPFVRGADKWIDEICRRKRTDLKAGTDPDYGDTIELTFLSELMEHDYLLLRYSPRRAREAPGRSICPRSYKRRDGCARQPGFGKRRAG